MVHALRKKYLDPLREPAYRNEKKDPTFSKKMYF